MPWPPSAAYLRTAAAASLPQSLVDFIAVVITGKPTAPLTERNSQISSSIAEDLCAAATCGRWKLPKHLLLGMSLRHLMGSA